MKENEPYYVIIPANVRYDDTLTANAKLLYGDIMARIDDDGYCRASNTYFAQLYNVSPVAISRWIKNLRQSGYIKQTMLYRPYSNKIDGRLLEPIEPR